jgi:hypothetical protein
MIGIDYSRLSTDELLQKFVEAARVNGSVYGLFALPNERWGQAIEDLHAKGGKVPMPEKMQSLGAELRRRKPIGQLRRLFESRDPDVRSWAATQFLSVDPEWATATMTGLIHNLSTREVLAWRHRILEDPPERPTTSEMTIPELLERFVDACERCYGATRFISEEEGGWPTMKAYNKISGEPYAVAKELHARGILETLVPMLDHPHVTVRQKAARYCLRIATDKAIAALRGIDEKDRSQESLDASWTLSEWAKGKYAPFE